jgi:hypothetical protein
LIWKGRPHKAQQTAIVCLAGALNKHKHTYQASDFSFGRTLCLVLCSLPVLNIQGNFHLFLREMIDRLGLGERVVFFVGICLVALRHFHFAIAIAIAVVIVADSLRLED